MSESGRAMALASSTSPWREILHCSPSQGAPASRVPQVRCGLDDAEPRDITNRDTGGRVHENSIEGD